ncbi:MAG: zinc-binding dehydrogenase [Planctomycetota bacterium]
MRSRSDDEKSELIAELENACRSRLEAGRLDPVVDRVFDFEQTPAALEYLASRANLGKVALRHT